MIDSKNTEDDNAKQLAVAIDKHYQEWADLTIKATKEGAPIAEHPNYAQIIMMAKHNCGNSWVSNYIVSGVRNPNVLF